MRRIPNPWVAIPVLLAAVAGGAVGYIVTNESCSPDSCGLAAGIVGTLVAIGTAIGVGVVVILALKSLAEHRAHSERGILTVDDPERSDGPPTC